MRTIYRCGVCGVVKNDEKAMRGHVSAMMVTNEKHDGDHPHWRELDVSHYDLSAWAEEVPGVTDF